MEEEINNELKNVMKFKPKPVNIEDYHIYYINVRIHKDLYCLRGTNTPLMENGLPPFVRKLESNEEIMQIKLQTDEAMTEQIISYRKELL